MSKPGRFLFYISTWTGLIQTRSILSRFQPFDQDPDGSGSIQRFWSVMEIRIHQAYGFGPGSAGLLCFFLQFLGFLANCTYILLPEPLCALSFLQKIPKKLLCVSWCIFIYFVVFLHFEMDKIYVCQLFLLIWIFLCSLWNFLHDFGANSTPHDPNVGYMILWWFCSWFYALATVW